MLITPHSKPPPQLDPLSMVRAVTGMADVFRFQILELFELINTN
jgi:hypothetical protein